MIFSHHAMAPCLKPSLICLLYRWTVPPGLKESFSCRFPNQSSNSELWTLVALKSECSMISTCFSKFLHFICKTKHFEMKASPSFAIRWWRETTDVVILNSPWLRRETGRSLRIMWVIVHILWWSIHYPRCLWQRPSHKKTKWPNNLCWSSMHVDPSRWK